MTDKKSAEKPAEQSHEILAHLLEALPEMKELHTPSCTPYNFLKSVARHEAVALFSSPAAEATGVPFGPFGKVVFPYHAMGKITTIDILNVDEFIIFAFYWKNRNRYKKVSDLGANLGLHSIMLSRCGFTVKAFEPDPTHFGILKDNLKRNDCSNVTPVNEAVSTTKGSVEFVRVLGNTTASHVAGAKVNPYGDLERFTVPTENFSSILRSSDLIKCDIEGHERTVLPATTREDWANCDAMIEIENTESAQGAFEHFKKIGVNLFAQKIGWNQVQRVEDMPTGYREGTLFITSKKEMPW